MNKTIRNDRAENSIMQTITIAVSSVLIASGLITAPGMIQNAQDNNARTDLDLIATVQAVHQAETGRFAGLLDPDLLATQNTSMTLSADTSDHLVAACDDGSAYISKAMSESSSTFFRASTAAQTAENLQELEVPACLTETQLAAFTTAASGPPPGHIGTCVMWGLGMIESTPYVTPYGSFLDFADHEPSGQYASVPSCADFMAGLDQGNFYRIGYTIPTETTWHNLATGWTDDLGPIEIGYVYVN